ncbi:uncharacterized protein EDB91DRAFT_500258 [Suillus paluster]|uniref:uncharacterized protein n=1 Tax=Suillus paluster TaxID=48578 RepID=UPI001B8602C9|nr:uncharacterized protein EDB91DRAFT_500258 [Suillus paluster]KAG1736640.1 hypothetical protein EDB91DRAFT_500258 [Suillus paluster]
MPSAPGTVRVQTRRMPSCTVQGPNYGTVILAPYLSLHLAWPISHIEAHQLHCDVEQQATIVFHCGLSPISPRQERLARCQSTWRSLFEDSDPCLADHWNNLGPKCTLGLMEAAHHDSRATPYPPNFALFRKTFPSIDCGMLCTSTHTLQWRDKTTHFHGHPATYEGARRSVEMCNSFSVRHSFEVLLLLIRSGMNSITVDPWMSLEDRHLFLRSETLCQLLALSVMLIDTDFGRLKHSDF